MVVVGTNVPRWGEVKPPRDEDALAEAIDLLDDAISTPFLINEELNFRVGLWQGDMTALQVDAVVNCNNQDLSARTDVSGAIFSAAGAQLEEACARLGGCLPGEAKVTRGFSLPAKHVIHTVPPSWSDDVDGENALERCYAASFKAALQLHCVTVAFACIKSKDAPREQAAHVALRAVRQLLEQPGHRGIQLVLFVMRPQDVYDAMVYENLMPLYFPRAASEEHEAAKLLPLKRPLGLQKSNIASFASITTGPHGDPGMLGTARAIAGGGPNPALVGITRAPAVWAQGDQIGDDRPTMVKTSTSFSDDAVVCEHAGRADFADIDSMQLFYRGGVDARGRPVFLFWAGHMPSRPVDLERVIMYLMRTLDAHKHAGYIIIYIHTKLSPENEPAFAWLRRVYDLFDQRLKENLHLMYVVHASWWLKTAMSFMRTFVASSRLWERKIIQLPHLADLFKRNYFAPGTLRLPNSPLVRKYLEMSNDAHMLETLAGGGAVTRDAITNVFATAVGAGVFVSNGTQLRDARAHAHAHVAAPAERAAVATATKEQECGSSSHAQMQGSATMEQECGSSSHAQMQGSREVLLKQLIELSDQLAQGRADTEAIELRLSSSQAAKDREIDRLSNSLYDAQRESDYAKRRLEQVHNHTAMQNQRRTRKDALAELADLEGQLAQTQVYNHHMANEMMMLKAQVRHDKWALLHEMSSLERQLEAARAVKFVDVNRPPRVEQETTMSRIERLSRLQANLEQECGEVACATRILHEQHGQFECSLKQAARELASVRAEEAVRMSSSDQRHRELQSVAQDLHKKIGAIRTSARIGTELAGDSAPAKAKELVELEAVVTAAAKDVDRFEHRLLLHSDGERSFSELEALHSTLGTRLRTLEDQSLERLLGEAASRKDSAIQAIAQQLVPRVNALGSLRAAEPEEIDVRAGDNKRGVCTNQEQRSRMVVQREVQASQHDAHLAVLEARAAEALASLEESFEAEVDACYIRARTAATERQHVSARMECIEARIRGLTPCSEATQVFTWPTPSRHRLGTETQSVGDHHVGRQRWILPPSQWAMEHLACFFQESADQAIRRAISKWQANVAFMTGLVVGGDMRPNSDAVWAKARADKVALIRETDEQLAQEPMLTLIKNAFLNDNDVVTLSEPVLGATAGEMVAITTDLCDHRAAHRPEVLDNVECYVAAVQECTSSLSAESPSSHMSTSSNRRSFLPSSATTHGSNDTWAQCGLRPQTTLKSLEATSAEHRNFDIADGLTVQNDVVAAAENTLVNAEGRLQDLRSSGGASDVIEGQREIDEVGDIRARARIALHSELHEHEVRDRQNASCALHGSVPLERLRDAETREAENVVIHEVASVFPPQSALELQVQWDVTAAELNQAREETRRLQHLIDAVNTGELPRLFQYAKEEAEKEVLSRMLSSSFELL